MNTQLAQPIRFVEGDDFWLGMHPFIYRQEVRDRAGQEVSDLIDLVKLPPSSSVLDLGCGPGRHAWEFARRGHSVTALDSRSSLLAPFRVGNQGIQVDWVEGDMVTFENSKAYDLIFSVFYTFGLCPKQEQDFTIISRAYRSLKSGGKFVLELLSAEFSCSHFQPRTWDVPEQGIAILIEKEMQYEGGDLWLNEAYTLIQRGETRHFESGIRLYYVNEIIELLEQGGFAPSPLVYGSYKKAPYDEHSHNLIVVAEKPLEGQIGLKC